MYIYLRFPCFAPVCLSASVSLHVWVVWLRVSISLSFWLHFVSLWRAVPVCLCLPVCMSFSVSRCLCSHLSLPRSISIHICVCMSLFVCVDAKRLLHHYSNAASIQSRKTSRTLEGLHNHETNKHVHMYISLH